MIPDRVDRVPLLPFLDDIPEGRQAVFHDHPVMIIEEDDPEPLLDGHLHEGFRVVGAVAEGGAQIHQGRHLLVGAVPVRGKRSLSQ